MDRRMDTEVNISENDTTHLAKATRSIFYGGQVLRWYKIVHEKKKTDIWVLFFPLTYWEESSF